LRRWSVALLSASSVVDVVATSVTELQSVVETPSFAPTAGGTTDEVDNDDDSRLVLVVLSVGVGELDSDEEKENGLKNATAEPIFSFLEEVPVGDGFGDGRDGGIFSWYFYT
jgi:hypothetical protein